MPTSWEDLKSAEEGKELSLRGFLVQAPDGHWILSSTPNLKSCCAGAPHLRHLQVHLSGDFSSYPANVPLEVRGTWQGAHETFALAKPLVISEHPFPIWTAGLIVLCLFVLGIKLKRLLLP